MPEDEEFLRRMREKQKYGRRKSVSAEGWVFETTLIVDIG